MYEHRGEQGEVERDMDALATDYRSGYHAIGCDEVVQGPLIGRDYDGHLVDEDQDIEQHDGCGHNREPSARCWLFCTYWHEHALTSMPVFWAQAQMVDMVWE